MVSAPDEREREGEHRSPPAAFPAVKAALLPLEIIALDYLTWFASTAQMGGVFHAPEGWLERRLRFLMETDPSIGSLPSGVYQTDIATIIDRGLEWIEERLTERLLLSGVFRPLKAHELHRPHGVLAVVSDDIVCNFYAVDRQRGEIRVYRADKPAECMACARDPLPCLPGFSPDRETLHGIEPPARDEGSQSDITTSCVIVDPLAILCACDPAVAARADQAHAELKRLRSKRDALQGELNALDAQLMEMRHRRFQWVRPPLQKRRKELWAELIAARRDATKAKKRLSRLRRKAANILVDIC